MEPRSCMPAALNSFTLIRSSYVVLRSCWLPMRSCSSLSLACSLACMHDGEQIMRIVLVYCLGQVKCLFLIYCLGQVLVYAMMLQQHADAISLCVTHVHEHANSLHTHDYSPTCQCCCRHDQKVPMSSQWCTSQWCTLQKHI